jgi:predicted phosphodiesterase
VRTIVISDLHLGSGNDEDVCRSPAAMQRLIAALDGSDRLVLLGDILELRDRPLPEALELSTAVLGELAEAMRDGEVVFAPGNHDHHVLATWLEDRRLAAEGGLELEQISGPAGSLATAVANACTATSFCFAYPGLWLRDDIYATHGHYLDRHLTVPTFERLGVAAVERALGISPDAGPDPLEAPDDRVPVSPEEYERAQAPVYELLFSLAQAGTRVDAASPSTRIWAALGGGESRAARLRGWLLGSVALPGAVGVANRLGLGPVRSDLSPAAIARAGAAAMGVAIRNLHVDAAYVIFGHTHRRGPLPGESAWRAGDTTMLNTGSWVHAPGLLGPSAASSPYWPGTIAVVDGDEPPRLEHLLDDLTRDELAELSLAR